MRKNMGGYHKSVLTKEALDFLNIEKNHWYLDCTLGDGGHSLEILKRGGRVVGIDVDPQALERAKKRLQGEGYSEQDFKLIQGNFRDLKNLIAQTELADQKFVGAIFDLGVSSLQLETPQRGFSFAKEGPLDMRMNPALEVKALDLISILSRKELYELLKNLGEEKYSRRLADALVLARKVSPFQTTKQLADFVQRVVGGRKDKIHPATKVFQALRIAVNDELGALEEGLSQLKEKIEKNGHIVVISFHSLEDRITKISFRQWQDLGLGQALTKKPIVPKEEEIRENSRSRSAKLRVFKIT